MPQWYRHRRVEARTAVTGRCSPDGTSFRWAAEATTAATSSVTSRTVASDGGMNTNIEGSIGPKETE